MRILVPILILLALIGGLVGIKYKQIATLIQFGKQAQKNGPPPEVIGTAVARRDTWEGAITAVGSVTAARGVPVSNEAPGVVTAIHFESGDVVKAGKVLVELDTSVERAQLAAAAARKELAGLNAGRSRTLVAGAAISKSQLDGDEAQLKSSSADLGALQAQIERKTVRAPFSGRLGLRTVNLGQYMNAGTAVSVLQALGSVYVDFSLPQQRLGEVHVGTPVRVSISGESAHAFEGVIAAIDPTLDVATRTIKLRASVPNQQEKLRPGMFVSVAAILPERASVVTAPATAVVHASYGDSVFVVEEKKDEGGEAPRKIARQQFVRLGGARGDYVAIADGVTAGQELVTVGAFKLRNGVRVVINNDVKAQPSLAPQLENH